jgi:hypothetical protein
VSSLILRLLFTIDSFSSVSSASATETLAWLFGELYLLRGQKGNQIDGDLRDTPELELV